LHCYTTIIIHAPIGGGKTQACQDLAERAVKAGIEVYGCVSPCIKKDGIVIGYNVLDLETREVFPLVRLEAQGGDWFNYGTLKYRFSKTGFQRGNMALSRVHNSGLVFLDEYGRLERKGDGFAEGFSNLYSRLQSGVLVVACRENLVDHVVGMLNRGEVYIFPASKVDAIWNLIEERLL
jgi:nucleoside-triphosphatase THEP1